MTIFAVPAAIRNYAVEQGGSFFRQFILVSNGVLPSKFYLHGKVERRALARMSDDRLFYIESRHPETMWNFADALREYGFADAIYITGGKCYSFYRTADGKPHSIGDMNQHPHPEYKKKSCLGWCSRHDKERQYPRQLVYLSTCQLVYW